MEIRTALICAMVVCPPLFAQVGATPPAPASAKGAPPPLNPVRPSMTAAAQRNENVVVYAIDNNAVKEANVRVGTRPTASSFSAIESGYFAAEHGQAPTAPVLLTPAVTVPSWHGELFEDHQNSVFNARTFFQVGPVQPSHNNHYGFRGTAAIGPLGFLSVSGFQRKVRGMVNGNVLVPTGDERVPLTTDPATRAIVQRFLNAYPNLLPNRPDFDPRALNTNAPQSINVVDGTVRLDRTLAKSNRIALTYGTTRQHTSAFQLVAGQHPDTDIHAHRAKFTYLKTLSPSTELLFGAGFQRTKSLLVSEPNAVGPRIRFGYQFEELGPDSQFPIDRAQNSFRYGAQMARLTGSHSFTFGGDWTRYQLNGVESNNQRGYFQFTNNFGRSAIQNLRLGTPSTFEIAVGELDRGFRNGSGNFYFADRWKLHSGLTLFYGLRYSLETAPVEVQNRNVIPYDCDCNNFGPRIGIAMQLPRRVLLRTAATVSFAPIQPVTYQQIRNNLPLVKYIQLQNPNLVHPLQGVDLENSSSRVAPTVLSPELTSSYAYQYNLSLEKQVRNSVTIRAGYIGSRSFKLINSQVSNRAEIRSSLPLTLATVDERRPDHRYYEVKNVINSGIAYFDAGFLTTDFRWSGLVASATYTFSKAIDQGSDFTSTAANRDLLANRAQWEFESLRDRKALSNFDSPHALLLDYSYRLPGGRNAFLKGWQLSGAALWKKGTPLTVFIGSDAPGFGNVDGSGSDRPNLLDPSILGRTIGDPNTSSQILSRDRFGYIIPGEFRGSIGRGVFRKSGIANLNAALTKQWNFRSHREWMALLRAEAYNLTNTPQFDEPQRNYSSPSFGRITNTLNDGRILQLGIRLVL